MQSVNRGRVVAALNPDPPDFLLRVYRAGVTAASPERCMAGHWPELPPSPGRLGVIACGKAAAGMAREAVRHYGSAAQGLLILPHEQGAAPASLPGFSLLCASHPVPDGRSVEAAEAALEFAAALCAEDLLLCLFSGGASALLCLPAADITLQHKQDLTGQLLDCGAAIDEINCVRRHLSRIKGGRLARATRARVRTLAISDVPGDDPATIASGLTVPDRTTLAQAREVLDRYRIWPGSAVREALENPGNESPEFTPQEIDGMDFRIVANGRTALDAAAAVCRAQGIDAVLVDAEARGAARELAARHARMALEILARGERCCLLSGGETSVRLAAAPGFGGRNSEYALALALELNGQPGIWALAADTDGIDGRGGHAGATLDPGTLQRARDAGLDPADCLRRHDSAALFRSTGNLLVTGPLPTNVSDFRAILVSPTR